ncbi:nuclear transport factor 2 family protein [Flavobacterium oreochromis]|uniref:nuclear transport factor 2 family protein n=1 Tax=Flavobacterium oreochromis TaxID=2906078 RepID=UPI000B4DE320|nr:nuclear transport factor 2 family protein [Flavobacterium oreochromis]OWP74506.1 hypothetical protein BWG23_13640 [Flavobacterium oreochromis]
MKLQNLLFIFSIFSISSLSYGQTKQDSLEIKKVALDYIESQHNPNPSQMEQALHPRMVKRTFWKDKSTEKDFLRETTTESMVLLAESYNKKGNKFPKNPKKDIIFLDVSNRIASLKLIADEWIDYMHIIKLNGKWKLVNVKLHLFCTH